MTGVGCFGFLDGVFSPHPWEGEHAVKTQKAEGQLADCVKSFIEQPFVALWGKETSWLITL